MICFFSIINKFIPKISSFVFSYKVDIEKVKLVEDNLLFNIVNYLDFNKFKFNFKLDWHYKILLFIGRYLLFII